MTHGVGMKHCYWDDNFTAAWRRMNDAQKRGQSQCSHCHGRMMEVADNRVFGDGSRSRARYWECEHYVGCYRAEVEPPRLFEPIPKCDCGAPDHDSVPLATIYERPRDVVDECAGEHDWRYEERFEGDYEGPSFLAPYGDRRWCHRCARPEVKRIDTAAQHEQISGVGWVTTLIYRRPLVARLLSAWRLDERLVRACKECDGRWFQWWSGSTQEVCPYCGAYRGASSSGYPVGSQPPPSITVIGIPSEMRELRTHADAVDPHACSTGTLATRDVNS